MIDLTNEKAVTLRAAIKLPEMQRDGRKLHFATIYRWSTRGVRGVILESTQQGSVRVTSREAIDRFFARLSGQLSADDNDAQVRTPKRRQRDHDRAEKELMAAGY